MARIETLARGTPGVAHTVGISGQSLILNANAPNLGSMYVMLKEFAQRPGAGLTADAIAAALRERCRQEVRGAVVSAFGAPPIDGLGTTGGFKLIVEDRGNLGLGDLQRVSDQIVARGNKTPGLQGLFNSSAAEHALALPRHRPDQVPGPGRAGQRRLQHAAGLPGLVLRQQLQRVRPDLAGERPGRPALPRPASRDIRQLQVRNNQGQMIPLGTLLDVRDTSGPVLGDALQHVLRRPPSPATPRRAPARAQAIALMQEIAGEELPRSMASDWTELTYLQLQAGQHGDVRLRAGGGLRLPGAGGAVRELDAAAGRHPGRADVPALLGRRRGPGRAWT